MSIYLIQQEQSGCLFAPASSSGKAEHLILFAGSKAETQSQPVPASVPLCNGISSISGLLSTLEKQCSHEKQATGQQPAAFSYFCSDSPPSNSITSWMWLFCVTGNLHLQDGLHLAPLTRHGSPPARVTVLREKGTDCGNIVLVKTAARTFFLWSQQPGKPELGSMASLPSSSRVRLSWKRRSQLTSAIRPRGVFSAPTCRMDHSVLTLQAFLHLVNEEQERICVFR